MQWSVAKIGFEMFDALHAYGLGILLATVSGLPITLRDNGPVYQLSSAWKPLLSPPLEIFDALFALPLEEDLQEVAIHQRDVSVSVATLDGLFALLFTKGERFHSVNNLLGKRRLDPKAIQKGLKKGAEAVKDWMDYVRRETTSTSDWFSDLLRDYTSSSLTTPLPRPLRRRKDLTVLMTLDPALGYSLRRPISDGQIDRKVNIALCGTRYATLLAYLGASRFLRAQQVAGDLVILSVPLASHITIYANTILALWFFVDCSPQHALVYQLLTLLQTRDFQGKSRSVIRRCATPTLSPELWMKPSRKGTVWKGLAYQTLQVQGLQQSISLDRGCLECGWLLELGQQTAAQMIHFWRHWLDVHSKRSRDEQERLAESLATRCPEIWQQHLCDMARLLSKKEAGNIRPYSIKEVKKMIETASTPLSTILERDEGTLCFGRALYQLGRSIPSDLQELFEGLETAQTLDQLLRLLHRAMLKCELAKAKNPFLHIPTNRDLAVLITDVDHYGVRTVASILMILSALHPSHRVIDKYKVHTLIGALLLLMKQTSPVDDSSSLSPESIPDTLSGIATFSLDEGEPDL